MPLTPADDRAAPWIAVFCLGVLLTSLSGATCLGVVALYTATLAAVQPLLACFAAGALLMLGAAARLDFLDVGPTDTRRR